MRIIIETDSAAAVRRIACAALEEPEETSTREDAGAGADAIDGGAPSEELLSALNATSNIDAATEHETDGAPRRRGENAGAAPAWLAGVIEGGGGRRPQ